MVPEPLAGLTAAAPACLTADWVYPVGAPPIAAGAVLVDGGRIAAVGPRSEIPVPPGVPTVEYRGAALLPGLVNAHTHLELTGLAGQVEHDRFSDWIRGVRELKAARDAAWFAAAARQGVQDAFAAGITMVLDTGDSGAVLPALVEAGGAGIVYQEVFGPHPDQCAESLAGLRARVATLSPLAAGRVRFGVSPHAPYTVSGPLYRATAALAHERRLPIAVHLAESPAETELVTGHRGPFADAWNGRGIPPIANHGGSVADRRSPVAWLAAHGVLGPTTLGIHLVQVDAADIEILRTTGTGVAHCPLSNARHGHGSAPVAALRAAGVGVGLGTDSVVSVGRLDLFAEMRAAVALLGAGPEAGLELATTGGAALAGVAADTGRLAPGFHADVIAVGLPDGVDVTGVAGALVAASPSAVLATRVGGRLAYRRA